MNGYPMKRKKKQFKLRKVDKKRIASFEKELVELEEKYDKLNLEIVKTKISDPQYDSLLRENVELSQKINNIQKKIEFIKNTGKRNGENIESGYDFHGFSQYK